MSYQLNATHLVGGVIYYRYLGGGYYEITFEVYKDCSPEVELGFDGTGGNMLPPFYFGVYEGTNPFNIISNNSLGISDTFDMTPLISNPCLEPNNSCVIRGRYFDTIYLPKNDVGYTIQYQRCCRNDGIVNILNQPGSEDKPGMTISTFIPPYGTYANNSAKFKQFPPVFICKGQPFYFDHAAIDPDGDVLRYSLTTPLVGLNSENPIDANPRLETGTVSWAPPYSLNNVLGGSPTMNIDSVTGLLYCNPNIEGRFVVSVKVDEIRNGTVISSFFRDFQYNVVNCDIPYADVPFIKGTYDPEKREGVYKIDCSTLTIDFVNTSTNSTSWEWRFGDPGSGANNVSTQKNPSHTFSAPGEYRTVLYAFKSKNGALCIDSTIRFVKVFPSLDAKFTYTGVCEGEPIKFNNSSLTSYGSILKNVWKIDNKTLADISPTHTFNSAGTYPVTLEVENSYGCKDDTTINVQIFGKPKIETIIKNACIGQVLNLDCNTTVASPSSISKFLWTFPDGSTANTCKATYLPTTFGTKSLSFEATSDRGCTSKKNFNVEVFPLPNIVTTESKTICYYDSVQLNTTGGISYSWTPTSYLSNPNIGNPIAKPPYPTPIQYIVEGTDANGCINYDSLTISFFQKEYIYAGPDTSVCLNPSSSNYRQTVQLNGQGNFVSQFWTPSTFLSNPNISNPIATPTENMVYVYHGIDVNQCENLDTMEVIALDPNVDLILDESAFICQYDTIVITPHYQGEISSYLWSPNYWISDVNAYAPKFFPLDTTTYILRVSNYCYTKQDTITINSSELPDPKMKKLDSICVGEIYQFDLEPYPQYQWATIDTSLSSKNTNNPTASPKVTTMYYVTATDIYGCSAKDSMLLEVNYPPSISIYGNRAYLCQGDSMEITARTDMYAKIRWWDETILEPDTGHVTYVFPYDTTQFFVEATSIQNCVNVDTFIVNVQKKITPYAESPVRICKGGYINLYASGGLYYLWKPYYNINDTLSQTPQVYPENTTNYLVYISNDCFIDSIYVDVYVDSLPEVNILTDTTIYRGTTATLEVVPNIYNFEWYPKSEMSNPYGNTITVSPMDTTYFIVEATDGFGCKGYDTAVVNVDGKNVLLIPTAFTPNGDGVNDFFGIIKHLNIKKLDNLDVYNRWGEKVFSTTNINAKWDGTFRDQKCESGVYVWHVNAVTYDDETITESGNVTLIR